MVDCMISKFDFKVEYVPGVDNILADALSHLYPNDQAGTVRSPSEYTQFNEDGSVGPLLAALAISSPVFVGVEALALQPLPLTHSQCLNHGGFPLSVEAMAADVQPVVSFHLPP